MQIFMKNKRLVEGAGGRYEILWVQIQGPGLFYNSMQNLRGVWRPCTPCTPVSATPAVGGGRGNGIGLRSVRKHVYL